MNLLNKYVSFLIIPVVIMSLSHCASTKKLQDKMPLDIGDVYYESTESGYDIFIPIAKKPNNITLDSVYFKGKKVKLEVSNDTLYIGHFTTLINKSQDIIMSSDPHAEYGNKVPELPKRIRFQLKDDECMVSYIESGKVNHFKITGISKK